MISKTARFLCCLLLLSTYVWAETAQIDFETQIVPLFQEHCVRCHSDAHAEGEFSLSTPAHLEENGYVVSGEPGQSYLLDLVVSTTGEKPDMPREGNALSPSDVETLRRWIQQGAHWKSGFVLKEKPKSDLNWWSYQPLRNNFSSIARAMKKPETELSIDDFVRAKLDEQGLQPSAPADRRTLIRRLSFDLLGLPPTPEAVAEFLNDSTPQAYENLVDRMLSSPHYGERFAQHWLDIAHYADTHGFERDQRRNHAWRYRDYVIESLNQDKPYDRFLQEQIAGDVLWPESDDAVIATGFLAAGPWDFVGQVETKSPVLRRAARVLDLDDIVTQVMTSAVGMTVNCARCHDHKLDPISQQEYYELQAVFAGVRREDRIVSDVERNQFERDKASLIARQQELDTQISLLEGNGLSLADIVGGGNGLGTGTSRQGIDPRTGDNETRNLGRLDAVMTNHFVPSLSEFVEGVFIPDGGADDSRIQITLAGETISGIPKTSGAAWDIIRNGPVASQHSPELDGIDFTKAGHNLLGLHANAGITFDLQAIQGQLTQAAEEGKSLGSDANEETDSMRFTAKLGYFGMQGAFSADVWVFVDAQKVAEYRKLGRSQGLLNVDIELPKESRSLTLIATDGGNGYGHDQVGFGDPVIRWEAPPHQDEEVLQKIAELRQQRTRVDQQLEDLIPLQRFYGIVNSDVPDVHVLQRGNPEAPLGDALQPGTLSALTMLDADLGETETSSGARRVALARWLTHPENPLVRRVIVNRLWQWHFGAGIVKTPSDFGFGGGLPSHPELLDWLALQLARKNWSLKEMHRLIVCSETYRQQSSHNVSAAKVDADNRSLWRQNSRRIEAEVIRDAVLFVSGCLNVERGGPGFEDFEYQEAYAPIYEYITANSPDLWRRSIYRFRVRTTPSRFLTTLDCPDPANLTPQRLTTTTPLQSLALYNNEFMLRQAEMLQKRIEREAGSDLSRQVQYAFSLLYAREPTANEQRLAEDFVQQAGLFTLCRSLLNSNEFVYVD